MRVYVYVDISDTFLAQLFKNLNHSFAGLRSGECG